MLVFGGDREAGSGRGDQNAPNAAFTSNSLASPGFARTRGDTLAADAGDEIVELWTAVYGEPPSLRTDVRLLIQVLVEALPQPAARRPSLPAGPASWKMRPTDALDA